MSALPRLFVSPDAFLGDAPLRLSGAEHHYLCRVLRLGRGDKVMLLGKGKQVALAEVVHVTPEALELTLTSVEKAAATADLQVTLYMGLLKGERHDLVIQKATELGAHRIVTVVCKRSVPDLEKERGERRQKRWQRIAQAAAQQCRRLDLPEITPPLPLAEALQANKEALRLMLYEGPAPPVRSLLCEAPRELSLLIGPEGGFEASEVSAASEAGFVPCSLGPRILRAETAALAALAVVLTE